LVFVLNLFSNKLSNKNKKMRIYVWVSPRSSKNEIMKISDGEYKVKLTAPPTGGKANDMLIKILADYFSVSKSSLRIIGGKTARAKIVEIIE
jgi:uncharacterized protein